jgi:hypothetical protein
LAADIIGPFNTRPAGDASAYVSFTLQFDETAAVHKGFNRQKNTFKGQKAGFNAAN